MADTSFKVFYPVIHIYFRFLIHSKFQQHKWELNQCDSELLTIESTV